MHGSADAPSRSRIRLRYTEPHALNRRLEKAGFAIEEQYGWFDRSPLTAESRSIVTVARKTG